MIISLIEPRPSIKTLFDLPIVNCLSLPHSNIFSLTAKLKIYADIDRNVIIHIVAKGSTNNNKMVADKIIVHSNAKLIKDWIPLVNWLTSICIFLNNKAELFCKWKAYDWFK